MLYCVNQGIPVAYTREVTYFLSRFHHVRCAMLYAVLLWISYTCICVILFSSKSILYNTFNTYKYLQEIGAEIKERN